MPVWKRPNVSSAPLWAVLSRFGVTPESWRELPRWIHRAVTAALVGVVLAVVLGPFFGVDGAALVAYALFVVLYVPGWVDGLGRPGRFVARLGVLALTVTYPYYADTLFTIPIFGAFPDVHTGVVMLIYVMMAVGLNVVVGYAGLLDLGYVAFYAIGAYTAASLASTQFAGETASGNAKRFVNIGAIGVDKSLGGIHVSIWLLLILAGVLTSFLGVLIGLPTLRLRGAYLAEFTTGANPDSFSFQFSVLVLVMVILGGIGNVWGVLVGAAFLAYLDQAGLANTGAWINQHLHVTIDVPKYEFGIYGVIL